MDDTPIHPGNPETTPHPGVSRRFLSVTLSLQCKATVLVVALTLTVTAVVSGYFLRSSIRLTRNQDNKQLVQLAAMLARNTAETVADGDSRVLQAHADEVANGDPLLYVIISDVEGHELAAAQHGHDDVLGQYHLGHMGKMVPGIPVYRVPPRGGQGYLAVTYPINVRRAGDLAHRAGEVTLVGYVHAGMIADNWQQWMSSKLDMVIGVGVLAIAVAIPLGFLLVRRIVSPLEGLAVAMRRFSQGRLDVRSPVRRRDEIGSLAIAFNRMADQHQQTHERIVRLNAELEERVARRTQQLRELAARDPLTGLYNRRRFNEVLKRSFSEAHRYDNELSCIMIDLDGFKAVNDAFGHHVGDEVLMLAASTISSQLRASDIPARFGGDEFIMLLPQTVVGRAQVLAERIAERFAQDLATCHPQVHTSLSMGIAGAQSLGVADAEALIQATDRALYQAKTAGRNCIIVAAATVAQAAV